MYSIAMPAMQYFIMAFPTLEKLSFMSLKIVG